MVRHTRTHTCHNSAQFHHTHTFTHTHTHTIPPPPSSLPSFPSVSFTFVTKTGEKMKVVGKEGWSLLDTARANDVDLEGACEASVACSTCHVIFDDDTFDLLEDTGREATEDEDDMLDMAVGLTMT